LLTRKYIVFGTVQGVGYRNFVLKVANKLGISGTVKNLFDGSVEIFAKGRSEDIFNFEERIERGSFFSEVTNFEKEDLPPDIQFSGFKIVF